ncbi:hypothetical protein KR018_008063, partial [Drosophila ironensis]
VEEHSPEDMEAFERRLSEMVAAQRPSKYHGPILAGAIVVCTAMGACYWLEDVHAGKSLVLRTLSSNGAFAGSLATLGLLLLLGFRHITRKDPAVLRQTRSVLPTFRLTCHDDGRLILIPPPSQ